MTSANLQLVISLQLHSTSYQANPSYYLVAFLQLSLVYNFDHNQCVDDQDSAIEDVDGAKSRLNRGTSKPQA